MKETFRLNDTTSVERKKRFKRTIIILNKNSQKEVLSD